MFREHTLYLLRFLAALFPTRTAVLIGGIVTLCATTAISQSEQGKSSETKSVQSATYRGDLDAKPFGSEFDFGFVPIDYKMVYRLNVNNLATSDTLQILSLKTTCECTVPTINRKLIAPGTGAELQISFDTKTFYGPQNRFVELHTTDPAKPEMVATFSASVGGRPAEVDMLPRSILNFSQKKVDTLKIKNFTSQAIPYTIAYQDTAFYRVEIGDAIVPANGYAELYIYPSEILNDGTFLSTLTLEFQTGATSSAQNETTGETTRISTPIKLVRY